MQEKWRQLAAFPNYSVSTLGRIKSNLTEKVLAASPNQQGHLKVKLMLDGVPLTRQINQLVAVTFLPAPKRSDFISIIHLDGDKTNCRVTNIDWRPRYFAIRYHQQFHNPLYTTSQVPVIDIKTGRTYPTAQQAAQEHGLVFTELLIAAHNRTFVWPTYQQFRTLSD